MFNEYKTLFWYYFCKYILYYFPNKLFAKFILFINSFRFNTSSNMNLDEPKLFHEKISFLKFNYRNKLIPQLADKISVRKYVKKKIGPKYLVDLIDIYDDANDIDFDNLPKKFVLKTSHGSSWNIICDNKNILDITKTKKTLNSWLRKDPFYLSREWQYNQNPKILCEKHLGSSIIDYKVYCFEGVAKFIQMDFNRFENHKRCFFDTNWNYQNFRMLYKKPDFQISRPILLEKMIELCEKLSQGLFFSRIDMYIIEEKIYFGEITFFPEGGNCVISPQKFDYIFSKNLRLEKIII